MEVSTVRKYQGAFINRHAFSWYPQSRGTGIQESARKNANGPGINQLLFGCRLRFIINQRDEAVITTSGLDGHLSQYFVQSHNGERTMVKILHEVRKGGA